MGFVYSGCHCSDLLMFLCNTSIDLWCCQLYLLISVKAALFSEQREPQRSGCKKLLIYNADSLIGWFQCRQPLNQIKTRRTSGTTSCSLAEQVTFEPALSKEKCRWYAVIDLCYYWAPYWLISVQAAFKPALSKEGAAVIDWFILLLGASLIDFCAGSLWAGFKQGKLRGAAIIDWFMVLLGGASLINYGTVQAAFAPSLSKEGAAVIDCFVVLLGASLIDFCAGSLWVSPEQWELQRVAVID